MLSTANGKEQGTATTRILIVDDHPIVRAGYSLLINRQPDLAICGETDTAGEALRLAREENPHLVIIDLTLKSGNGLELCKQLAHMNSELPMLVISAHDEQLYADRALRCGARGFINKEEATTKLIEAIRTVMSGKVWLSSRMTDRLLARVGSGGSPAASPMDTLSDRELEVFELIGQGQTTHQIAARLHLSPKTVESYRENLKKKLNLRNSTELTQHAVQWVLESK